MAKKPDGVMPSAYAPENYYGQIDGPMRSKDGCLNFAAMYGAGEGPNAPDAKVITPNGNASADKGLQDKANFWNCFEEWERPK